MCNEKTKCFVYNVLSVYLKLRVNVGSLKIWMAIGICNSSSYIGILWHFKMIKWIHVGPMADESIK